MSCFCLRHCPGLDREEHRLWCWKEDEARKVASQKEKVILKRLHENDSGRDSGWSINPGNQGAAQKEMFEDVQGP